MHARRMTKSMRSQWYVVQCKPRQESRALEHLERQGYSCYLPTLQVEKLQRGRRLTLSRPLFPRYLFIRLDEIHSNWYPIRSTCGVSQLVRFNDHPLPVADEVIALIQERVAEEASTVPYLRAGERVRVTEGAFADVNAIFLTGNGDERVVLLMDILHREHSIEFPVSSVRKVG